MKYWIYSLLLVLAACSSKDKLDTTTAQGAYELAERYVRDDRYEDAIEKFEEVKNKHPYSKYAVDAKLRIADVQYTKEAYIEAQHAYQLFKDLHPKHAKSDYVTYRLAMSFYNQLPSSIDRDLSVSDKAVQYFDEVVNSYPNSEYVKDSKEKKQNVILRLASKEYYIAEFYFIREKYDSALARFEGLLKTYPDTEFTARSLYGAAVSANELGQNDKGQRYFSILKVNFGNSSEYEKAKSKLKQYD